MASGATEGELEELSGRAQGYPRDLLRRFAETSCDDGPKKEVPRGASEEVELSLGLSLNGCFGVEPKAKRLGLVRSSSIASFSMFEHDFMEVAPLTRTCSLPTETEEELRKRKELQSLKRLEAKRKRSEKRNSKSGPRDSVDESLGEEVDERRRLPGLGRTKSGKLEVELNGFSGVPSSNQLGRPVNGTIRSGLPCWAATGGGRAGGQNTSQVSIGPQGSGGSSGASDFEHQPMQEDRSPPVIQSLADHTNHKASPASLPPMLGKPKAGVEELSKKTVGRTNGLREMERNVMEEMPCVSTKGDGPNGRRIEGFLYRYRKGEEVRIVCVCHGSFLTPAEFVRHAGGGDVDHPLRHIVVYPTTSAFL